MILYTLVCEDGHRFESWFRNSDAFDDQSSAGHLACPICHSDHVAKAVMAPALVGKREARADEGAVAESPVKERPDKDDPVKDSPDKALTLLDPESRQVRDLLQKVRAKVLAEGHDVGPAFAAEARRIHEGDAPDRQIYGLASVDEARELAEDGILVLPLPIVPDELN